MITISSSMLSSNHGTLWLHSDDDQIFPVSLHFGDNLQVMLQKTLSSSYARVKHFIIRVGKIHDLFRLNRFI